jgi:hypothetical protein
MSAAVVVSFVVSNVGRLTMFCSGTKGLLAVSGEGGAEAGAAVGGGGGEWAGEGGGEDEELKRGCAEGARWGSVVG